MAKFCVNCGTQLPDGAGFCPKCGAKIEVPHCPSCGKEVDFDTEYCIYCGAQLKEEPVQMSKPIEEPIQPKSVPVTAPKKSSTSEEKIERAFSWTYKRAHGQVRWRHDVTASVDNECLHILECELEQEETTEVPLNSIRSIKLDAKASMFRWVILVFCLSLLPVGMIMPIGRNILSMRSVGELLGVVLAIIAVVAVMVWRDRFQLSHYRLTIMGQVDGKETNIFLEDMTANTLEQIQATLTQVTGITARSNKNNAVKVVLAAILGIALSVATIFFIQARQAPGGNITTKESPAPSPLPSTSVAYTSPDPATNEIHQYTGQARGFGGTLAVQVSVLGDVITKVEVIGEHFETVGVGADAIEPMIEKIVGLSTIEAINAVDCVSGATYTSEGIKEAVINALAPDIQSGKPTNEDRSTWEYDDYVNYYGFDPADYGYMWYNSMRSGPLEDFFEGVNEAINGKVYTSRLYEITNPWEAELTPDDFVGTWQTDDGIIFSIENRNGEYAMDLSENEGLGMLGGWFTYALYNVEEQFCGMSGENGVTSFSVSYGYSTDYPTSTWLELVLVNFEGVETRDYVSLY